MRNRLAFAGSLVAGLLLCLGAARATTVLVDATADIFLAGQTSVPTNFPFNSSAPGLGAGSLPPTFAVTGGEQLILTATGTVSCCFGGAPTNGPNGGGLGGTASITGYGNVGPYSGVQFPLVGVFGGPTLTTPWSIFVIGSADTVVAPAGATELYLGLPDALGFNNPPGYYNDNTGGFTVEVTAVPEPSTWLMMIMGFLGLGLVGYRRRETTFRFA